MPGWNLRLGLLRREGNAGHRISLNREARVVYQREFSTSRCAMRATRDGSVDGASCACVCVGSITDLFMLPAQWEHPISTSERLKDRKSVFMAHASTLTTSASLDDFISHLVSLPALKKATHCMYAYRIAPDITNPSIKLVGQSDGGERGSGERLTRLLEALECENVIVVVSRWYGGVKLGSDRWKLISTVAKEALYRGNFVKKKDGNVTASPEKPNRKSKKK